MCPVANEELQAEDQLFLAADTEEHQALVQALALIRDAISQVDHQVSQHEKAARLRELVLRLEPKSQGWQEDGPLFRREDLLSGTRTLLHEGPVSWKSCGRQKGLQRDCVCVCVFVWNAF